MSTSKNNSEVVRYAGASGFKGYGTDSTGRGAGGFKGYGSGGGDNYSQYDNEGNEYKYDKKLNAWVHWVTEPNGNSYPIFRDKDGNPTKVNPNQPVANVQPSNAPPQISEEEKAARAVSDEAAKRNKVVPKRKAPSSLLNVNEMFANAPAWGEEPDHAPTEIENREHYWNGAKLVRFLNGGFAHLAKMRERGASQESINIVLNVIGRYMESTFREAYQRGGIGAVRSIERGLSGANANGVVHGIITQDISALIRSGVCGLLKKYENLSADEYFKFAKHSRHVYNARVKDGGNVFSRENTERAKEPIANTTQGVKDGESKGNGQEELSRVSVDGGRIGSGGRPGAVGLAERNRSEADAGRTEQSPDNGRGLGVHQDGEIAGQTQVERPVRRRQLPGPSAGRGGDQGITPEEAAREVSQEAQKEEEKPEEPKDRDGGLFDFANQNPEPENESEAETNEEPETEQEPVKTPVLEVSESFIKEPITSPSVVQGRAKPGLIDGTPATEDIENEKVYGVHVSKLHLDPARFQFKQNVDKKTGAGDSLAGAKFDRVQANTLLVWRDPADGLDYVVNGHHRFNLALQSGYDGYINVCYSRAKTAEEAKVDGAVANIVDGKGTEIDAADIIRVHPDIENDERVKGLVGDNIRLFKKGKALASLAPEIYDAMKKGFVAPHTILPLGEILPNDFDRQMLVWNKRVHPRPTIAANAVASAAMFAAGAKGRKIDNGNQMVFDFFSDATSFDEEFDQGSKLIEGIQRYLSSKRGVNAKLSRATNTDTLDENTLEGVIHNANAKQEAKGTTAVLDWLRENGYHKPGLVKDIFQDSLKKFLEIPVKDKKAQNACIRDAATKIQDAILHGRAEDLLRGLFASNNDNEEKNTDGLETVAGNDRPSETSINASSLSQEPSGMAGKGEDGAVSAGDGTGMDRMADETAGEEPSGESGDGGELTSEPEPNDSPTAEATEVAEPTESADEISQSIVAETEDEKPTEPEETAQETTPEDEAINIAKETSQEEENAPSPSETKAETRSDVDYLDKIRDGMYKRGKSGTPGKPVPGRFTAPSAHHLEAFLDSVKQGETYNYDGLSTMQKRVLENALKASGLLANGAPTRLAQIMANGDYDEKKSAAQIAGINLITTSPSMQWLTRTLDRPMTLKELKEAYVEAGGNDKNGASYIFNAVKSLSGDGARTTQIPFTYDPKSKTIAPANVNCSDSKVLLYALTRFAEANKLEGHRDFHMSYLFSRRDDVCDVPFKAYFGGDEETCKSMMLGLSAAYPNLFHAGFTNDLKSFYLKDGATSADVLDLYQGQAPSNDEPSDADTEAQAIVAEEENRKEEEPAQEVPPQEPIEEPTQEQEPEQEAPEQLRPSLNLAGTPERVNFIANKALGKVQTLLDASKIYNKQSTIDAVRIIRTAFAQNNNDARCKEAEKAAYHCILCLESLHDMKGTQERLSRENYLFNLRYRIRNIFNDGTKPTTEPTETAPKPDDTASEETKPVPETPEESAMKIGSEVEGTEPEQTEQAAMEVADEAEEEPQEEETASSANSGRGPDGYYKVNEDLARWANDANSYRDYKAGSANREYQSAVNVMRGIAERRKETCDDETRAKIDRLLDSYERKLANWYDRYYRNESYAPSILVAGGSNFPVKKKERQNNNRRTLWKEHEELNGKYKRLISGVGTGGISSDDKDAVPQLEAKLAALEKRQKDIVEANKYFRKNNRSWEGYDGPLKNIVERWSSGWGWPRPLMTTNNGAEIRRIKGRIEELNRKASSNFGDDLPFDGGRTTFNKADNRIEIYHDEKPSPETISELKHNGFKWSPKKKAWQRQITDNAIIAAKMLGYIPNTWEPTKEESAEPEPDEPTPTPQEPTQEVTPEAAARQVDADVKENDTPSTPPDALFEGGTDYAEEPKSEDDTPFFPGFEHDEKKKKASAPKAKQDDDKPMTDEELHAAIQSYRPDLLDYEPLKDDEAPVSLLQFEHDEKPKEEQKEEETPEEAARTINAETSGDVTAPEPKQEDDEKKDRPFGESWNFKGGSVTPNYDKNRLEIRYDSVPSKKTLKMLEEDGFTVRRVKQEGRQLPQYVAMRKLNEASLQLCKDYGYTPINGGADKKKELTTTEPKPEEPKPEPKPEDEPKPPQNPEERRRAWARAKEQSDWDKRMAIAEADVDRTRKRPINKTEHAFEPPKDWKSQVFTPGGEADGGIEPPKASRMTIARAAKRLHNAVAASADRNKAIETITSIIYPLSSYTDQIVNGQIQASGYQLNLAKRLNHLCGQLRDRAAIEAAINKSCASPGVLAKFLRGLASKVDLIYQPHDASFPELVYNPENLPKTPEEQAPAEPETSKDAAKDFEDDEETRKGIEATSGERSAYDWYGHAGVELAPEEWERYKEKRAVADDEWRKNKRKRLYQKTEENGENSTLQKTPTTSVSY